MENNKPKTYYCNNCEDFKESMDMHSREDGICKLCWSKEEDIKNLKRSLGHDKEDQKDREKNSEIKR